MGNSLPQIILAVLLALAMIGNFLPGRHRPSPNPWRDAFGQIILIGLLIWGGFFRAWGL